MAPSDARSLFAEIASVSRPAGSSAEGAARAVCAAWLVSDGFQVTERPFEYSTFPGRWGMPIAGAALFAIAAGTAAVIATNPVGGDLAMRNAFVAVAAVAAVGWWIGRYGTRAVPAMRRRGVNLEARRGEPRVWLVAHLDSKSQPLSLLSRAAGSVLLICGWVLAVAAWIAAKVAPFPSEAEFALMAVAAVSALSLAFAWIGDAGSGALDNASGVAAVLGAARTLDPATPVGVVVTSAEELGLAGARAWAAGRRACVAINCDGVDDTGPVTVTASGRDRVFWKGLWTSAGGATPLRFKRSLPGVLLDSSAFAEKGWTVCTVSKGTRASLARIHTRRDTLAAMSGSGVDTVQRIIALITAALVERSSAHGYSKGGLP